MVLRVLLVSTKRADRQAQELTPERGDCLYPAEVRPRVHCVYELFAAGGVLAARK